MLTDERSAVRTRAIQKTLCLRKTPKDCQVRAFVKPRLALDCTNYTDMCNWEKTVFHELPLMMHLTSEMLEAVTEAPAAIPPSPCHSQAVERFVNDKTEVFQRVAGAETRDGLMRGKLASRQSMRDRKAENFQK